MGDDARGALRHSAPPPDRADEPVVPEAARRVRRRHHASSASSRCSPRGCARSRIAKTEPGDENNQDISSLVGKVDIRKLETLAQNDPDAYSYSGGLNRANQGILEFVEMFKAPIKMLHPLLTATQEGNYIGTENIGAIPFTGIILAHSNEAEWQSFKNNKNNEAFIDRIYVIKVPYCLRVDRGAADLREADPGLRARRGAAARRRRWRCWRASRCCRACASTRTRTSSPRCASMTARACGGRSARPQRAGIQGRGRRRRGHGRHLDALRLQGAGGDLQPRHRSRSPPIRCI